MAKTTTSPFKVDMNIERIKIRTERYSEEIGPSVMKERASTTTENGHIVWSDNKVLCLTTTAESGGLLRALFVLTAKQDWDGLKGAGLHLWEEVARYKVRGHVLYDHEDQIQALFTSLADAAFIRDVLPMLTP
jgi:hypothetical protein